LYSLASLVESIEAIERPQSDNKEVKQQLVTADTGIKDKFDEGKFDTDTTDTMAKTGKGKQALSVQQWLAPQPQTQSRLVLDPASGLYWPEHSWCQTTGCSGNVTLHALITFPEQTCWFCGCSFLNMVDQTSIKQQQAQLIEAAGGLHIEEFAKSKMAKMRFGYATKGKESVADKGAGKNKVKGKFDKGKDKGKNKAGGRGLTHSNVDIRTLATNQQQQQPIFQAGTLAQAVFAKVAAEAVATGTGADNTPASSRAPSASPSTKKKDPQVAELLATMNGCTSIQELRDKLAQIQTEDDIEETIASSKSLCAANHDHSTAVAQAFRKREDLAAQIENVREEIRTVEKQYRDHVETVRAEYRLLRDTIDNEQDKLINELQTKKEDLKKQHSEANAILQKAHIAQMEFYNKIWALGSSRSLWRWRWTRTAGDHLIRHLARHKPQLQQRCSPAVRHHEGQLRMQRKIKITMGSSRRFHSRSRRTKLTKTKRTRRTKRTRTKRTRTRRTRTGKVPPIQKKHSNKLSGSSGHQESKPSEEEEEALLQQSPGDGKIEVDPREWQFVVKAATDSKLMADETYMANLKVVLNKYSIALEKYTEAVQTQDQDFFSRFVASGSDLQAATS